MTMMRRVAGGAAVMLAVAGAAQPAMAGGGTGGSALCVGGKGCFATVQAAVDAAPAGATIRISPGRFAGGVTIAKSVKLVGAGVGRTSIVGGDSVIRITSEQGRPTVGISALTVTGGKAKSNTAGVWTGTPGDTWLAFGGGVLIAPAADGGVGAEVTLDGVEVAGNRAAPTGTYPSPGGEFWPMCGDQFCPSAGGFGGGIASFGNLTLRHSVVRDNGAVGPGSDAAGGGIYSAMGDLRVESSRISGNDAVPEAHKIGRYAEGGGVFVTAGGSFTMRSSQVQGNVAALTTDWPTLDSGEVTEMVALGGALHLDGAGETLIEDSTIKGNVTRAENRHSEVGAWGAVMTTAQGRTVIRRSVIQANPVTVIAASADHIGTMGPIVQLEDNTQISDTRIVDNALTVLTRDGGATAVGTIASYGSDVGNNLDHVVVTRNTVTVRSDHGAAVVVGVGIANFRALDIRDSVVSDNVGKAAGSTASAVGGGIWNGTGFGEEGPAQLSVHDSRITGNAVSTSPKGGASGGGIYTQQPFDLARTRVAGNRPDNCVGCSGANTGLRLAPHLGSPEGHAPQRLRSRGERLAAGGLGGSEGKAGRGR